jgi:hypothetical protein
MENLGTITDNHIKYLSKYNYLHLWPIEIKHQKMGGCTLTKFSINKHAGGFGSKASVGSKAPQGVCKTLFGLDPTLIVGLLIKSR